MIPRFPAWVTGWMELIKMHPGGRAILGGNDEVYPGARAFVSEVGMTVGFSDSFRIMLLIDNWSSLCPSHPNRTGS